MMRLLAYLAVVLLGFQGVQAADVAYAKFSPVSSGAAILRGRVGEGADACIRARCRSAWARKVMYDECADAFRTGWDDRNHGWQNEYWGKTMLCFARAIGYTHDLELKEWTLGKVHAFLSAYQKPNGYISTYSDESYLKDGFSVWGRKYTLWALITLYRETGDMRCLQAAEKLMDNLRDGLDRANRKIWQTGIWNGVSSMSILKPVLELYVITKNESYLSFAREIVTALGNPELREGALLANARREEKICTWFPQAAFWAKAYEIMSCLEGVSFYYRLTGDRSALDGVLAYYGHLEREELNPMRSAGYFDHFLNARERLNGMTELCDVTHWIRLNRELLLITGDAKYADRMEEAFYNAFLAGVTRDGRWGAHIIRSHGSRHLFAPPQTGMYHHQCCPDNMMRTYFDMAESMAAVSEKGELSVIFYADGEAKLGEDKITITGGYPWGDESVNVRLSRKNAGKVHFRIPSWSTSFEICGKKASAENGWYGVDAPAGESVWTLAFDLAPRTISSPCSTEQPLPPSPQLHSSDIGVYTVHFMEWYTSEMRGHGRTEPAVQVMRGPLVLAKGRLAGTTRARTFSTLASFNGTEGWSASLKRMQPSITTSGVPDAWLLTLTRGIEEVVVPVSDFAAVSNVDDPDNWFSLWF